MPRLMQRPRRGFTLVELLVTVTILGVIGTVLAKMMINQQRFFQRTVEQTAIRRELRTSMSILPAELRSLSSSGGDVSNLTSNTIQFRGLLGASIVCAKPTNTQIDVPPVDLAKNVLTSWYTPPVVGDTLYAFNEGNSSGAEDDSWEALRITAIATSTAVCVGAPYTDAVLDAGKLRYRFTVNRVIPDSVKIGAGIRFYRHMRYNLSQSSSEKWYMSRSEYVNGVWSNPTYISGPFRAPGEGGMNFRYFDSTGVEVAGVANATKVARIDVMLRVQGLKGSSTQYSSPPKDSLALRIALRNRQ